MRKIFLSVGYLVSCFFASPLSAMSFSDAYQQLLIGNVAYQQAHVELKAAKTGIRQALGGFLPMIQANVASGYVDGTFFENSTREDQYSLSLRQPIYDRVLSTQYQQAKVNVVQAELNLERILQEQLLALSQAYFGVMQSTININIIQREASALQKHYEQTKARQAVGLDSLADVYEASSRKEETTVRLQDEIQLQKQALVRLQQVLQYDVTNTSFPRLDLKSIHQSFDAEDVDILIDKYIEQNNAVQLQRQRLKLANLALKLDKADILPKLNLTVSTSQIDRGGQSDFESGSSSKNRNVMLELSIPLFSGLQKMAKSRQSQLLFEAEKLSLQNIVETEKNRIRTTYGLKKNAFEKMNNLGSAFESASKVVELRKENFFSGVGSNLDVLNAYQSKHNRERLWVSAIFDYLTQLVQFNVSVGRVGFDLITEVGGLML